MMFSLAIWLEQLRLNALLFRAILQHSFDALQPETAIYVFSIFGTLLLSSDDASRVKSPVT